MMYPKCPPFCELLERAALELGIGAGFISCRAASLRSRYCLSDTLRLSDLNRFSIFHFASQRVTSMALRQHGQLRRWTSRASSRRRFGSRPRFTARRTTSLLEQLEPRIVLAGDLRIAEVMTDNNQTLQDEDGSYSDWLEIYNAGHAEVDLSGWHLTDRINDRTQWTFDGGSLEPGQSLLVFASGKDRRDVGQPLHTNFKLSEREYLGLYQPDGRTVSDQILSLPPPIHGRLVRSGAVAG